MIEVSFQSCRHIHEKGFVDGKRKEVRDCVAECLLRAGGLNPLCAHPTVGKMRGSLSAMSLIKSEIAKKISEGDDILHAYSILIKYLDDVSYFVNTNDFCRTTSGTPSGDIILSIEEGDNYNTLNIILDLGGTDLREINSIVFTTKNGTVGLNAGQKGRTLFLMERIQDKIENGVRKLCTENNVELVDSYS